MYVQICDLNKNENLNTFEKSERTEIIGAFQFHLWSQDDEYRGLPKNDEEKCHDKMN